MQANTVRAHRSLVIFILWLYRPYQHSQQGRQLLAGRDTIQVQSVITDGSVSNTRNTPGRTGNKSQDSKLFRIKMNSQTLDLSAECFVKSSTDFSFLQNLNLIF